MAEIRAAGEVMNKRPIAAEQIVGPTLASARPGQAPALPSILGHYRSPLSAGVANLPWGE